MLAYTIKSAIYLSIMYIPYMLLLRRESFFRFNRIILLCILMLSVILPLCDFHSLALEANPIHRSMVEVGMPIMIIDDDADMLQSSDSAISWITLIAYAYFLGMVVTFLYKLFQMVMLYRAVHHGVLWMEKKNGIRLYCHINNISPFSLFNTIVISEHDYNNNAAEILGHEMGHIRHGHSWDILLVNIVGTIQWWNPLVWILASSLRDVHEYEADDAVLRSGVNARQYQTLLIRKAVGSSSYTFANSFNHSQLKKRFTMMFRKQSNPWMRTKALYIIPVAAMALSVFATPELNNRVDIIAEETPAMAVPSAAAPSAIVGKGTTNSANVQENSAEMSTVGDTSNVVIGYFIPTNVKNEGTILYILDGKEISHEDFSKLEPSKMKTFNMVIIKKTDDIKKYTDKPEIKTVILISQKPDEAEEAEKSVRKAIESSQKKVYDVPENMPTFPGGKEEMMKFLAKNLTYPEAAKKAKLQGRVLVEFYVEKDGSIANVKSILFKGKSGQYAGNNQPSNTEEYAQAYKDTKSLETEAERVVSSMPKWNPGMNNGQPIRTKFVIPVIFSL